MKKSDVKLYSGTLIALVGIVSAEVGLIHVASLATAGLWLMFLFAHAGEKH
jgi:hypothetical protein